MAFFDFLSGPNINKGLEEYGAAEGAMLLDVRTPQEYSEGHIPGSRNIPYHHIDTVSVLTGDKNVPLYLYCHSGARSGQAAGMLRQMGYTQVRNLGGISSYLGKVVRS